LFAISLVFYTQEAFPPRVGGEYMSGGLEVPQGLFSSARRRGVRRTGYGKAEREPREPDGR
jgi:hypothetical protein